MTAKKFKKILVANRGEIAVRVMQSAAKRGIIPVAVYSDADKESLHVLTAKKLGGEAYPIGAAPSSESYLNIDKIIEVCKQANIDAVHPGYGFLSENSRFCAELKANNIAFIGPPPDAIEAMGDKIRSKLIAEQAGVNIVPGHTEAVDDPEQAVLIANKIGYPVMLKASAGGGGKGMRLAYNDEECRKGLIAAMNEGRASFGDDRVFVEKFIERPRHIEIQVLGDQHGNVFYIGERECSLQRRHQKVIEEAPSSFLDAKTREAMGEQAVALARAVGYFSAGTVEFIVDQHKQFYFLEMNTRLQVEHPVTELVFGLDLVDWMIRIAEGEALTLKQTALKPKGWAVEARIYAEDPERGFLPSIGRITDYLEPDYPEGFTRIDSGCYEGAAISIYYDPMIAKLICYGETRDLATYHLQQALDDFVIRGVNHNITFLANLIRQPFFKTGELSTDLIGKFYPDGLEESHLAPLENQSVFTAAMAFIWLSEQGHFSQDQESLTLFYGGEERHEISIALEAIEITDQAIAFNLTNLEDQITYKIHGIRSLADKRLRLLINDALAIVQINPAGESRLYWQIDHQGARQCFLALPARLASYQRLMPIKVTADLSASLQSPMPGMLTKLLVKQGDQVKSGQELAIVEAMKMENVLHASRDGIIDSIMAQEGDSLAVDQTILTFAEN